MNSFPFKPEVMAAITTSKGGGHIRIRQGNEAGLAPISSASGGG